MGVEEHEGTELRGRIIAIEEAISKLESGGVRFLVEMESASEWKAKNALESPSIAPPPRSYLSRPA